MSQEIVVRRATSNDVAEIRKLWIELTGFHAERDEFFIPGDDGADNFMKWLGTHINSKRSSVLVAAAGDTVVGFILCAVSAYPPVFTRTEYGQVYDLAVTGKYQRRGIGQRLLAEAMRWFRDMEMERIEVNVASSNEVANAFWSKMGFSDYLRTYSKEI